MDLEETVFTLQSKCEQLWQENNQLKAMLGVVRENQDLKARMQSFSHDTLMDPTGILNDFFSATRWHPGCSSELL